MMSVLFRLALVTAVTVLVGCSDDDVLPPSPLPDFEESITIEKRWSTRVGDGAGDYFIHFTPSLTESFLYAVSRDGDLVKFDRNNGKTLWAIETGLRITGGPAAGFGRVVVGTANGEAVAFDETDGRRLWKVALGGQILSPAGLSPDRVVVQTIDGRLHGLDVDSGKRLWPFDTSIPILTSRGESSPMIVGSIVLAGFANGKMVALQAEDGFVGWERAVAEPQGRSELERLVDIDGRFDLHGESVIVSTLQGKIAALDIPTGRALWSKPFSSHVGLSVHADTVFATSDDSDIVALDAIEGVESWRQDALQRRGVTAPVAYDDYVVAGDFEGYLHWLERDTGKFLARIHVDDQGLRSPPVVRDGVVYVQSNSGIVAAYAILPEDYYINEDGRINLDKLGPGTYEPL